MENHRTGLLVVLAGYADKIDQLMDSDPGLRRRFSLVLELQDYRPDELALICEKTAKEKFKLSFAAGLREALAERIALVHGAEIGQHNGGLAVTLAERAFRRLAMRLGRMDDAARGPDATVLLPEDFEISSEAPKQVSAKPAAAKRAGVEEQNAGGQKTPQLKRFRSDWREVVGCLAKDIAVQLLQGVESMGSELEAEDDDAPIGGSAPSGPSREERGKAIAKALAKSKEKEKQKEAPQEEEQMPVQEGEKVLEAVDTLEALECLGLCPAQFEWFEINIQVPPDANCGICAYKLSDGYRCGGGTHFVCLGCIDAYKTRERR